MTDSFNEDGGTAGLHHKYRVERVDGSSAPGAKHEKCDYFVLDLVHDARAKSAIRAYAAACDREYPALARDLRVRVGICPECRDGGSVRVDTLPHEKETYGMQVSVPCPACLPELSDKAALRRTAEAPPLYKNKEKP